MIDYATTKEGGANVYHNIHIRHINRFIPECMHMEDTQGGVHSFSSVSLSGLQHSS